MEWGPAIRPTRAEIDLDALVHNARLLAARAASPILAVVKADAYGHGAVACARALEGLEVVAGFAVSLVEEGIELRRAGIEAQILVMGPSLMDAHAELVEHRLTPMVSDQRHLQELDAAAASADTRLPIHLKVDTGMSRLGLAPDEVAAARAQIDAASHLYLDGIATHFACADVDEISNAESMTRRQIRAFEELLAGLELDAAVRRHAANSAGILRFDELVLDLARPGLALYGNGFPEAGLRPVMSLHSQLTQLRRVRAGESVSYGALWTAERDSLVGIVPAGYADGYPRNLTGKASVLLGGSRVPVIGAVSMDMSVVDLSELPEAQLGDEVVLLGVDGAEEISAHEWSEAAGISEYEVTCGISKRVPRVERGSGV